MAHAPPCARSVRAVPRPAAKHEVTGACSETPIPMATALPEGCWPTMITPYNAEGQIDYPLLKALIGNNTFTRTHATGTLPSTSDCHPSIERATVRFAIGCRHSELQPVCWPVRYSARGRARTAEPEVCCPPQNGISHPGARVFLLCASRARCTF